jgi:amidase
MVALCDLGAAEARRLIGEKRLCPVDLLESCIERIEAVNPAVNAVVTTVYESARAEAKAALDAIHAGKPLGLLHGLPVVIKDLNATKGIRTTLGSPLFKDNVPTEDDSVVARLRKHGAIILGKTNTPDFGCGSNTTNPLFGATSNPFDLDRTSGGSSGGAGAALATGMTPLANGSDSGASIRNPAAFCGVFGIRPTPGLVASKQRGVGLSVNGVEGPLGRSIADLALLLSALAEYDSMDMLSRPIDPSIFLTRKPVDVSTLRVAYSEDLGFAPVDTVVRKTFQEKIELFSERFAICEAVNPDLKDAESAYWGVRGLHLLAGSRKVYDEHRDEISSNLRYNIDAVKDMTAQDMANALAKQTQTYQKLQPLFQKYDILITPVANVLPFPHAQLYPEVLEGRPARHYAEWFSLCYGISLVGHPALSIPAGLDPQGTPFGLQVVGARHGDQRLLEVGEALESLFASIPELKRPLPDISKLSGNSKKKAASVR